MIKQQFLVFLLRWISSSFGMFLCISWFGAINQSETFSDLWLLYVVAGLIFSLANSFLKPFAKMLALPLAMITLGISTAVINAFIVIGTVRLLPGVEMNLFGAIISSLILSGINTIINLTTR